MPKKRRKTVMKGLRFTVPLIRLVMPLDSPDAIQKSPSIRPQTLLRLVRIETPLEALLPNQATAPPKAAPPSPAAPTLPKPAPKKRSKKTSTTSRANDGRASPRRKNK